MKIPRTKRYSIYKKLVLIEEQRRINEEGKDKKLFFEPDDREHYVYRVTDYNRTEKEHYYGSHTPKKDKKYNSLEEEFWTYRTSSNYNTLNENKKEHYKVKILKVFDNPADKMIYEAFLHQYFDVKSHTKFWNESNQTPFSRDTSGKVICIIDGKTSMVSLEEFKNNHYPTHTTGKVNVKDKEGNMFNVSVDNPKLLSGELVSIHKGRTVVKDKNHNVFSVSVDDPRYKSGELVGVNKGKVIVKDKDNNVYSVSVDDPRYKSGDLVHILTGTTTVKDKEGNTFKTTLDNPKLLSGELVNMGKDTVHCFDNEGNTLTVSTDEFHSRDDLFGMSKDYYKCSDGKYRHFNHKDIKSFEVTINLIKEMVGDNDKVIECNYLSKEYFLYSERPKNSKIVFNIKGEKYAVMSDDPRINKTLYTNNKNKSVVFDCLTKTNKSISSELYAKDKRYMGVKGNLFLFKDNQLFRPSDFSAIKGEHLRSPSNMKYRIDKEQYIEIYLRFYANLSKI